VARYYDIAPKTLRNWRKNIDRLRVESVKRPTSLTLHMGPKLKWPEIDDGVYSEYAWLRGLGVGVASTLLFGLMEARVPEFSQLSYHARWNWFTSFTKRHELSMRRPSRTVDRVPTDEDARVQCFISEVREKVIELQVQLC
jgi:hypothetical protein